MKEKHVLTALETEECPPHHWDIDSEKKGKCRKCPEVKDFGALQRRYEKSPITLSAARRGGKKKKGGVK